MKRLLLSLIFLLPTLSFAQEEFNQANDFVSAHKSFFTLLSPEATTVKVGYLLERAHEEKAGPGEFDLNNFTGDLELARPISQDSFLTYGGHYEARAYDFNNVVGILSTGSETLHRVAGDFGAGYFLREDLLAHGQVTLGLHSNFEEINSDALKLFAKGLLVYRYNPGVQLLGGFSASDEFEDTSVFPLIGFRLLSADGRVHISLTAPLTFRATYNLETTTQVYAGYWTSGNEYNLEVNGTNFDIFQQDCRAGVGFTHWFNEHVNLTLETGGAFQSELRFKTPGAGTFSDGDLENAFYAALRIGYSL